MELPDWTPPDSFPDLSSAQAIALDIETYDPDLKAKGPGVRRGGYPLGVAIGTPDGFRAYYPLQHPNTANLNRSAVFSWLTAQLNRPSQPKVGANILYDLDYLTDLGVKVSPPWYDVQIAEPLLNENDRNGYSLERLSQKYLGESKKTPLLAEFCKEQKLRGEPRQHIYKMPGQLVGPYAEGDVDLPLRIFPLQKKALQADGLWDLFLMESRLLPLLLRMRQGGVKIDTAKLEEVIGAFEKRLEQARGELNTLAGREISPWAAKSVQGAFDEAGLTYNCTPTGLPSFRKPDLEANDHPLAQLVLRCRTLEKFIGTFLRGQIRDQIVVDRLHTLFNSMRSDEFGTVTGRFSSSHPNLQNMPARGGELGPLCRSLFIPERDCTWGKVDYASVEFRIFAHYAVGEGSEDFRDDYNRTPEMDFHQRCANLVGLEGEDGRSKAKTINFGIIYGMGLAKTARSLGLSLEDARTFLDKYHAILPFARHTLSVAADRANRRGWVRTVLGRRRRFDLWEPLDWGLSRTFEPSSRAKALEYVEAECARARREGQELFNPGVRRASTHKALNAVIQGSAADLMKAAMVNCWEAGLFDVLAPHLTVHDELDCSIPQTPEGEEAWKELIHRMETAITFKVPILADAKTGPNWGAVE